MTDRDGPDPGRDMARLWSTPVVPVEDPERSAAREEKTTVVIAKAIRRAAEDKRKSRRRRRVAGALLAAAAIMLVVGFALRGSTGPTSVADASRPTVAAEVRAVEGRLEIVRGGKPTSLERGHARALATGDVIVSPAEAFGTLSLSRTPRLDVASSTRVVLDDVRDPASRLRVDQGHIGVRVDGVHDGVPKLVVDTPDASIVVVGTVFTVDVSARDAAGEGFTLVAVMRGTVAVMRDGVEVARVVAGQTWSSRTEDESKVRSVAAPAPETAAERLEAPRRTAGRSAPPREGEFEGRPPLVGTLGVENALYQQAIDARNSGEDATMIRHLNELLARFPESPLAEQARAQRERAEERLGSRPPAP
jgi:hypothetical protein